MDDLGALLVPVGGGGLISGMATAVRALRPGVRIVGVEPELAADAQESFRGGELVAWPREKSRRTIADGARTNLAPRTFAHIQRLVDDIVTVDEAEIAAAVRLLAERARLVVEPTGALAVAAATFRAAEAGLTGIERPGGGPREWRERRSRSATASTWRRRSRLPAEGHG